MNLFRAMGAVTTSAAVSITVNAAPTVSLTSPANNATFTAPATITLTATAADSDGTITQVEFFQGDTLIATATSAPYIFDVTNVGVGNYSFTARATDNLGAVTTSSAINVTVNANQTPTVMLTATPTNAIAPATITITATANDTDGTIAKVEFYEGANLLTTLTSVPYTFNWPNVQAGNYTLFAKAYDDRNAVTTSSAVNVTINPNQPPSVTLTSPNNNATYTAPATITLTANANDTDGSIAKVEFLNGANVIATTTTPPYIFDLTNVSVGSYTLTARATDDKGVTTTSDPVMVSVTPGQVQVFYIYTDQLNTPRVITDQTNKVVWRWDNNDPFGANVPDEDPNNTGNHFTCNLRFPGQYFDKETNLNYNYFRDYDPSIGRHVQSDPIGLVGGINIYTYAINNPLTYVDPQGLNPLLVQLFLRLLQIGLGATAIATNDVPILGGGAAAGVSRGTASEICVTVTSTARFSQLRNASTFLRDEAGVADPLLRRQIIQSFGPDLRVGEFQGQAYQYSGFTGTSSVYLTPTPVINPIQQLALPPSNPAALVQQYTVAPTRVIIGTAAPQNFGSPLSGGAQQIFIPSRSALTPTPLLP